MHRPIPPSPSPVVSGIEKYTTPIAVRQGDTNPIYLTLLRAGVPVDIPTDFGPDVTVKVLASAPSWLFNLIGFLGPNAAGGQVGFKAMGLDGLPIPSDLYNIIIMLHSDNRPGPGMVQVIAGPHPHLHQIYGTGTDFSNDFTLGQKIILDPLLNPFTAVVNKIQGSDLLWVNEDLPQTNGDTPYGLGPRHEAWPGENELQLRVSPPVIG
jgi:hypothetical protein